MIPLAANPDGPDVAYVGDYPDFPTAQSHSTGYYNTAILERTRVALHKVLRGEAAYERDSATFDKLELPYPLLAILSRVAAENSGRLSVLDFGGSLGSTYFQCRSFLSALPHLEWSIVEQPAHVACGAREFANEILRFYPTIDACRQERHPNLLLLSGVLQYLPDPWAFLREAATYDFQWIVLDRTAFIPTERDRLTVEVVSPRLYPASYPAWFLSRPRFLSNLPLGWTIEAEFDAIDRQLLDGVAIIFKGVGLKRSS